VRITSLDPASFFSERCHTMLVNTHGCGVRFTRPLKPGMRVKMEDLPGGKSVIAFVASNHPLSEEKRYWIVGIGLESPGNPWCLAPVPADWKLTESGETPPAAV
jgi:hypothetical protein